MKTEKTGTNAKHCHHLSHTSTIAKSAEDPRPQYDCDGLRPFPEILFAGAF